MNYNQGQGSFFLFEIILSHVLPVIIWIKIEQYLDHVLNYLSSLFIQNIFINHPLLRIYHMLITCFIDVYVYIYSWANCWSIVRLLVLFLSISFNWRKMKEEEKKENVTRMSTHSILYCSTRKNRIISIDSTTYCEIIVR